MAYPVYEGNGGIAAGQDVGVNVPYPSTVNADDILVIVMLDADNDTFTIPTGSTTWYRIHSDSASPNLSYDVFWTRALGTESGTITVNSALDAGQLVAGIMYRFSGCIDNGTPFEIDQEDTVLQVTESSQTLSPTDTLGVERLVVQFQILEDNYTITADTGAGFAQAANDGTTLGSDAQFGIQTKQIATAGQVISDDHLQWYWGGTSEYNGSVFLALIPAAGGSTKNIISTIAAVTNTVGKLSVEFPLISTVAGVIATTTGRIQKTAPIISTIATVTNTTTGRIQKTAPIISTISSIFNTVAGYLYKTASIVSTISVTLLTAGKFSVKYPLVSTINGVIATSDTANLQGIGIEEIGSANNFAGSGTAVSVTHGLTINEGDVVVAVVFVNGASTNIITDNNGSFPFVKDYGEIQGDHSANYSIYSRVAGSSEPSSYNWTAVDSERWSVIIRVFSGVDNGDIWDVAPSASTRDSLIHPGSTTATAPSMTTNNDGAMGMLIALTDNDVRTFSSPTNGYGNQESAGQQSQANFIRLWASAGVTGTSSATLSAAGTWYIHQVALKPATSGLKNIISTITTIFAITGKFSVKYPLISTVVNTFNTVTGNLYKTAPIISTISSTWANSAYIQKTAPITSIIVGVFNTITGNLYKLAPIISTIVAEFITTSKLSVLYPLVSTIDIEFVTVTGDLYKLAPIDAIIDGEFITTGKFGVKYPLAVTVTGIITTTAGYLYKTANIISTVSGEFVTSGKFSVKYPIISTVTGIITTTAGEIQILGGTKNIISTIIVVLDTVGKISVKYPIASTITGVINTTAGIIYSNKPLSSTVIGIFVTSGLLKNTLGITTTIVGEISASAILQNLKKIVSTSDTTISTSGKIGVQYPIVSTIAGVITTTSGYLYKTIGIVSGIDFVITTAGKLSVTYPLASSIDSVIITTAGEIQTLTGKQIYSTVATVLTTSGKLSVKYPLLSTIVGVIATISGYLYKTINIISTAAGIISTTAGQIQITGGIKQIISTIDIEFITQGKLSVKYPLISTVTISTVTSATIYVKKDIASVIVGVVDTSAVIYRKMNIVSDISSSFITSGGMLYLNKTLASTIPGIITTTGLLKNTKGMTTTFSVEFLVDAILSTQRNIDAIIAGEFTITAGMLQASGVGLEATIAVVFDTSSTIYVRKALTSLFEVVFSTLGNFSLGYPGTVVTANAIITLKETYISTVNIERTIVTGETEITLIENRDSLV